MDKETKNEYIIEQQNKLKLIAPQLIPLNPTLGYYLEINGVKISQQLLPKEYSVIVEMMYQAFAKISKLEIAE